MPMMMMMMMMKMEKLNIESDLIGWTGRPAFSETKTTRGFAAAAAAETTSPGNRRQNVTESTHATKTYFIVPFDSKCQTLLFVASHSNTSWHTYL